MMMLVCMMLCSAALLDSWTYCIWIQHTATPNIASRHRCVVVMSHSCQGLVISEAVKGIKAELVLHPEALICVGTYAIGKENLLVALARDLGMSVSVSREKYYKMKCMLYEDFDKLFTLGPSRLSACVLFLGLFISRVGMFDVSRRGLLQSYRNTNIYTIGVSPTGWNYKVVEVISV